MQLDRRIYAIVFLVSLALLNAQVAATRLLAYKFFYHFVFFVISLSQLGLAAAGAWVYAEERESYGPRDLRRWLVCLALYVLVTLTIYMALAPFPTIYLKVTGLPALGYLLALALPLVAINFAGGMVLTIVFSQFRRDMSRLYASDLAGASLGCLASVGLMALGNPIRAFLASGLLAMVCARWLVPGEPAGGGDLAAPGASDSSSDSSGEAQEEEPPRSPERVSPTRNFQYALLAMLVGGLLNPWIFDPNIRNGVFSLILRTHWDHLARTDAIMPSIYMMDGRSGTALTVARTSEDGGVDDLPGYQLVCERPRVAVLGAGAGPQLIEALAAKARQVVALDINAPMINWSLHEDKMVNRRIFYRPGVEAVIDEGRHFLQSRSDQFDLISMFGLDTYSASAQGAYAMTENFLYTVEAFEDILDRLAEGGVLATRRWLFYPPRENMRLFTTQLEALRRKGAARPEDHVLVMTDTRDWRNEAKQVLAYNFFSKTPFSKAQLEKMDRLVERLDWTYLYRPGGKYDTEFHELVAAPDRARYMAEYPYVVEPTTDRNPFFFQLTTPWSSMLEAFRTASSTRDPWEVTWAWFLYHQSSVMLAFTLLLSMVLTALMLGVPLYRRRRDLRAQHGLGLCWLYFSCLGVGFMGFELPVIQIMTLFLGHPTYALTVVILGILAAAGTGSYLVKSLSPRQARGVLLVTAALALASAAFLLDGLQPFLHLSLPAKIALTLAYLFLVGIPLGIPFASGIREIESQGPHHVAWSWASNGAASVVGSCLLTIFQVYLGSSSGLIGAAFCYLVAFMLFPSLGPAVRGGLPSEAPPPVEGASGGEAAASGE